MEPSQHATSDPRTEAVTCAADRAVSLSDLFDDAIAAMREPANPSGGVQYDRF